MKKHLILLSLSLFLSLTTINVYAHQDGVDEGVFNKDGSYVTGVLTASFDPFGSSSSPPGIVSLPTPTSLAFFTPDFRVTDMTLNIPVADPDNFQDPKVALNSLDGWSTTEKWITGFSNNTTGSYTNQAPGSIDPTSVVTGQSVRVFEVTTSQFIWVTGIVRELTPGVDYVAVPASASQIAILPLKPLKEYTDYMAVLTNDINDLDGNDATPDRAYGFGKTSVPWVDENGHSTNSLFDDASAASLELIRTVVQSMELNAAAYGINPDDIVLAWVAKTQSIKRTLKTLRALAQPAPTQIVPTGMNTHDANPGLPGLADIYIGVITLPYYLGAPSADNPIAPLTDFWKAAPGAYVPPFDQFGLDPTSTHITIANPMPVLTGMETVPLLVTVPNANSGFSKPADGWPVVIYMHGLTRNRTDALAIADSIAMAGYAVVSMDQTLHGVVPDVEPQLAPFYIENTPFAPIAHERTFDADYWDNVTGAPGPDEIMDPSGRSAANLANLQAFRDNIRQGIADLSILALSLQNMSIDGDSIPDLNAFNVALVSHSAGSVVNVPFLAIEPIVSRVYMNAAFGGVMRVLNGGHFGPDYVQPFLSAFAGIEVGTPEFEAYLLASETVLDSANPINWATDLAVKMPFLHNQVQGDGTVPNVVPFAPLAGSEALNKVMGLAGYSTTQARPEGFSGVARFVQPADHESLFRPIYPEVTIEMQSQMVTYIASKGTFVEVGNSDLLVPVVQIESQAMVDLTEKKGSKYVKEKKKRGTANSKRTTSWLEMNQRFDQSDRLE